MPYRTAQRWLAAYRRGGRQALARPQRVDKGRRKLPDDLVAFVEGLALEKPRPPVTVIDRQAVSVAAQHGWPTPGYFTVYEIACALDPALVVLAHQGAKRYREVYELVHRREATAPNETWQADHTEQKGRIRRHAGQVGYRVQECPRHARWQEHRHRSC